VLNTDHYKWLTNKKMALDKDKIFLTAHWADKCFSRVTPNKENLFRIKPDTPVMLYAGRISEEKGVMELPDIYLEVKRKIPGVTMVIAGTGPAETKLQEAMPEAVYLGWVDPANLAAIYSSANLLVFPSKFDTFSCAVLEALTCGLPVIAYNTKGPKDILWHGVNGYLVSNRQELIDQTVSYFKNPASQEAISRAAIERSGDYRPDQILERLLADTGLEPKQFLKVVH
jgi:glycosyltransferase involved in cell wall biosynthesis